ncbi:MAG: hypothetical protein JST58_10045 [Bacteroidetes bacterium]|nr:hypothetical protein [Bacteroidota bacterium]
MGLKRAVIFTLLIVSMVRADASWAQAFDKATFYASMRSNDLVEINAQLKHIENSSLPDKDAFLGALLMKKAELVTGGANKLNLFKSGRKKLESSIRKENANAEFRFLRLMIQEHAPSILHYQNELENDMLLIKKNYANLPIVVQQAINHYSKESKILKPVDF